MLGVIVVMLAVRFGFRIALKHEADELDRSRAAEAPPLARANLEVANPNLVGMPLEKVPLAAGSGLVVSRVWQDGTLQVPRPETRLKLGDVLLAVGRREDLDALRVVVGRESTLDLRSLPSAITAKRADRHAHLRDRQDDRRARLRAPLRRADHARQPGRARDAAHPGFELQYGDTVLAVGEQGDISKVAAELGDSPKSLNYPHLVPMFLGIALGVVLGSWPFSLPGVPAPVRLGLAGGPLVVAILLARLGKLGPLVWYLPISANYALRETGIMLFLGAVGLGAGDVFVETLVHGDGLYWMACGALITLVPMLVVAVVARAALKMNFLTLSGLLAGSMTDPPALSFATGVTGSEAPSVAYATVYPLTMILRVLSAQLLVLYLVR